MLFGTRSEKLRREVAALARAEEKIEEDEREIEHLRAQIEKLRRMLFGTRSEKLRREV
ncbi:hypothetical protein, partial [Escherichia coli]|uniref:IS66 family transposase n=1 Tax=Escherichia coli TaxID=562 RepID=UPI003F581FC5